jgi:hypothetical protein
MDAAEELTNTSELEEGGYTTPIDILSSDEDGKTYKGDNSPA